MTLKGFPVVSSSEKCHFKVPGVSSGPNVGVVNDSQICSNAA